MIFSTLEGWLLRTTCDKPETVGQDKSVGPVWAAPTPRSRQANHLINNLLHRLRRGLQMGLEHIWLVFKEGVSERLSFKIAQNPGYENRWA